MTSSKLTGQLDRPLIMGVVNRTPDSFYDGGCYSDLVHAKRRVCSMVEEGADIIDVGGESTRPGSEPVSVQTELCRVIPLIEYIRDQYPDMPISIDTTKPEVMRAAIRSGAVMVNDVNALEQPGAMEAVFEHSDAIKVVLMHKKGHPKDMQANPNYEDVVQAVQQFLESRIQACLGHGIERHRLIIDPGIGFGKALGHNLCLLNRLEVLQTLGCPIMVGVSRKSMIGKILNDCSTEQRLYGSLSAAVMAYQKGALLFRVHDVKATRDAIKVAEAIQGVQS